MSARLVPLIAVAIVAGAAMLHIRTAAAGSGGCGCEQAPAIGGMLYEVEPEPMPLYPLQPTFHVEQGPTYHAVIIADDQVERRLTFAHPHYFPYIRTWWFGDRHWQGRPVADTRYRPHHIDLVK